MEIWSTIKSYNTSLRTIIPLEKRSKPITFVFVLLAVCLDNLSVAGNTTTFFSVIEYFNTDSPTASWTLSAYALTLGAFIMLTGKITDILGPELVFLSGIFLTGLFALICAVTTKEIIVLIVFRAIQGIFAASLVPSSFAIASSYFKGRSLGIAINGLIFGLTSSFGIGIVVGGAFSSTSIGYKGVHYLTFAISWLTAIVLYFSMYPIERTEAHNKLSLRNLDYAGSLLFVVSLILIILGLTEGGESWKRPSSYVPLVVGVLILITAFLFEIVYLQNFKDKVNVLISKLQNEKTLSKQKQPDTKEITEPLEAQDWRYKVEMLFPREMFKITNFLPLVTATLLLYIAFFAVIITMIQYYQYVEEDSSIMASVKALPICIGLTIGALVNQDSLLYKIGMKRCLLFSQVLGIGTIVWITRHDYTKKLSYWKYDAFSQLFYGYSINLYFNIYLNAIMRRAPVHLHGVISGFLQTVGQLGICLANSLLSSIMGELELKHDAGYRSHLSDRFSIMLYIALAGTAVSFFALLFIKNQKAVDNEAEANQPESNDGTAVSSVV